MNDATNEELLNELQNINESIKVMQKNAEAALDILNKILNK